ncbi:protein-glutamine gamma-glutamyltransferase K-like [Saccoglossus kowalevskii]|uniref:Protein-glutamine gamma-glutamyltransferase K-like n=1 Tax=Saccoglossus kowalevskii TaxID=10224 RepID=A0ABM0GKY8_SACKO|nr:PREDICTED: protein-glutamine gamma-glutamyltransferase K-like [Saccoglossus kowalevskii]
MPRSRRTRAVAESRHGSAPYFYERSIPGRRIISSEEFNFFTPPESDKQLKVVSIDLEKKRNSAEHHTEEYEVEELVVRRGQKFHLTVFLNQEFKEDSHKIELELRAGKRPRINYGTRVPIPQVTTSQEDDWGIHVVKFEGNKIECVVYSAADCLVTKYKLFVETSVEGKDEFRFENPEEFYMIFNPWCKADDVYMEDDSKRNEYVLNDFNRYYYGNSRTIGGSFWYQGQFEAVILPCALQLLDQSGIAKRNYSSPIHVVRALSAVLNSQDDNGVLEGNWSGDYEDGTEPTDWAGSVAILQQYVDTGKPVKYGQCWVFAGLFTTVLRALGIPARTVTNFESAHDTDGNLTLDYHYSEDGEPLEDLNDDSVWNFHVWNDCWMARPDLPAGYGGWQAADATPQETSEGIFRTGPASLAAIKNGDVYLGYDTKFIFAEVNAESVNWIVSKDKQLPEPVDVDPFKIGKNMSTKAVDSDDREDVTLQYKHPEGSDRERLSVLSAIKHVKSAKKLHKDIKKDARFEVDIPDELMIGKPVDVKIKITNDHMTDSREVVTTVTCNTVYYTGVKAHRVKVDKETLKIGPGETITHGLTIEVSDYQYLLTECAALKFFIMAGVKDTKQTFAGNFDFRFRKPDLEVTIDPSGELTIGDPFKATVMFTNPLPITLQFCSFRLEGAGIDGQIRKTVRNVPSGKDTELEVKLTPVKTGRRKLLASFHSKQLSGVTGMASLEIVAAE